MHAGAQETAQVQNKDWRECVTLRTEIARLRNERKLLLQLAAASAMLVRDLDEDTFETHEAAELICELLQLLALENDMTGDG